MGGPGAADGVVVRTMAASDLPAAHALTDEMRWPHRPADWEQVHIQPPRAVNVDVGRNSAAMLSELKAGTRTYQDVLAETGCDWRAKLRQKAAEAQYIRQLAQDYGVTEAEIADAAGQAIAEQAPQGGPDQKPRNLP